MKKNHILAIVFLLSSFKVEAQVWSLVWADEFNGTTINTNNWTYDTGGGGWGNNELEYYTSRAVNATVSNGNLLIIARKEAYNGSNYTSARMKTQGLQSWTYGKIEARIKLPAGGQGLWPAFWTLGDTISKIGWPKCGELDILETINSAPTVYGTAHWYNNADVQSGKDTACNNLTGYHIYSIEWDSSSVKWFFDNVQYCEVPIANNINNTQAFHKPYKDFILLNMAIGGNWPGNPNSSTKFPDTMYVDYVRVYQLQYTTSVNEIKTYGNSVIVYPNPSNGSIVLASSAISSNLSITIYNLFGEIVFRTKTIAKNTCINLNNNPSGIYTYQVDTETGSLVSAGKFILQH